MSKMDIPTKFVDKAKFVLRIFTDVETEYESLLRLMTLTFDSVWRRRMLSKIDFSRELRVLDLASGTGLVTFEVARSMTPKLIVGLDLSPAMLRIAARNKLREQSDCPIEFVKAAGEFLPFRNKAFGYITVGLALRNFADKLAVFKESQRILGGAGCFLSVDFVRPNSLVWPLYRFHIFHILPTIGRSVVGYLDEVEKETRAYLKGLTEEDFGRRVGFILSSGQTFNLAVEECLFQSFTEQLYHIGELIALLWQDNVEPPRMQWFWNTPRE